MISEDYNIKEFINEVQDKKYIDIFRITSLEAEKAENDQQV